MANDGNIKVNIDVITNMTNAVKGLQDLAEKAKTHAKDINRTLESALKMPNMFGKGGGVFGNMLQSMKEMQRGISTVSTTMRESMGEVKGAVDSVKDSIMNLSTSIKSLTGKSHKVRIEQEVVQSVKEKSGGAVITDGASSATGVVKKTKVSKTGEALYDDFLDTRAEIKQKALSAKESREYRKRIEEAEARDRQRVTPLSANQYAMDLQKKQAAEKFKPFVESEIIRQRAAYEDKKSFEKLDNDWIKDQKAAHNSFRRQQEKAEQERFQAEKDIHKQYVSHLKRQADLKIADDQTARKLSADLQKQNANRLKRQAELRIADDETVRKLNADIQKQDLQEQARLSAQKIAYQKAQDADRKRVTPESATQYGLSRTRVGAMTPTQAAAFAESEMIRQKTDFEDKKNFNKLDAAWVKDQQTMHRAFRKQQEKEEKAVFEAERDIHRQYIAYKKAKADQERAELARRIKEIEADEKKGLYDPQKRVLNVDKATPYDKERLAAFGPGLKGQSSPISEAYLDKARWAKGSFKGGDAFINDAKRYVKYAVNDLGMSIVDAMKVVRQSTSAQKLSQNLPGGILEQMARYSFGGQRSDFVNAMRQISGSLTSIDKPLDGAGKKMGFLSSMMEKQGEAVRRLGRYYVSFFAITSAVQQFTEAMRQAKVMQDEMLELKKFLPEGSNIGGLRQNAYSMAAEFGVSIDTVLGSFTEFAKQGKQANEILEMTRSALLGVNVASTDFATTVTYLTTVTNVWKDQFNDTSVLIDKLSLVQAKSSASSEVLIAAMQRSASMAKTMGVSLDQLFGYVSAVSEKTQLSGEVIGNSLKTILERAQRLKTLNLLQGMEEFKDTQFVSPISGEILGAPEILEKVAQKWSSLSDVQRKYIGEQMAGSRQLNAFSALMLNMGRATELTKESLNSLGYAQKANDSEMQKFSKSFQKASSLLYEMSTSVILPMVGHVTSLMNIFSALMSLSPGLNMAFAGIAVGMAAFSGISTVFSYYRKEINTAIFSLANWSKANKAGILSGTMFKSMLMSLVPASTVAGFNTLTKGVSLFTSGTKMALGASLALRGALSIILGPLGMVAAAAAMAWSSYASMAESSADKQRELNDSLSETIKLFKELENVKAEPQRLEVSRTIAKTLGVQNMAGLKMERDPESGALVPAYKKESDVEYNKQIIASKNAAIGSTNVATDIVALGRILDEADKKLKRFVGETIEDEKKVIQTLVYVRNLMADRRSAKDIDLSIEERISELEKSMPGQVYDAKGNRSFQKTALIEAQQKPFLDEIAGLRNVQAALSGKNQENNLSQSFFEDLLKTPRTAFLQLLGSEDTSKSITGIIQSSQVLKPVDRKTEADLLREEEIIANRRLSAVREVAKIESEIRAKRISVRIGPSDDYLGQYAIALEKILKLEDDIAEAKIKKASAIAGSKEADDAQKVIDSSNEMIETWRRFSTEISSSPVDVALNNLNKIVKEKLNVSFTEAISTVDSLSGRLLDLSGKTFTVRLAVEAFLKSMLPSWLSSMLFGEQSPANAFQSQVKDAKALLGQFKTSEEKEKAKSILRSELERSKSTVVKNQKGGALVPSNLREIMDMDKAIDFFSPAKGGGAAKRDQESTAHYNALERMKKAEADFQKQQQMASYWEGKSPDKYLLKYDAETRKYEAEMKAKQAALDSERANLKPDEVKRLQEEINVLEHKIKLQNDYRKNAQEIAAFEQWQSDNKVGIERLRTEMAIKSEMYEMEFAALYSPSRAEEKAHLEWKIKANLAELEAQKLIQVEEAKVVEMMKGKSEAEALSIALSTEEIQLLNLKIQKEQQMLGLIDRQLELKQKQKINEQVREVQGMISSGIFDALSLKSKSERKKQLAELAQELSKLSGESETASYGIAQAESVGNIDSINSARSKWNEVNKQIEEARKKMDEVNNSTNKWKEVLQNIGDSVLKKLSDKFAEMLINKTGLGDIFGTLFGGIDKINSGGKSSISAPSLSDPRTALGTLALGGLGGVAKGKGGIMDMFMPGISNSSIQYNVSAAGGAGNPLGSLLGGGLNFGGGAKLPANYVASARNGYTGRGIDTSSAAKKYGTSQYLTSAMLGYAIGSSTSNRAVGALGGAAAGFLTGGPIGAVLGLIGGLFGRKKDDTPPPVQPQREFYALFRNSESLDRNTSALMKLSEGVFGAPSVFEVNKLQAERNMTSPTFNITINATSNSPKAIASEVNAVISNSYQTSLAKTATSTSNWG